MRPLVCATGYIYTTDVSSTHTEKHYIVHALESIPTSGVGKYFISVKDALLLKNIYVVFSDLIYSASEVPLWKM